MRLETPYLKIDLKIDDKYIFTATNIFDSKLYLNPLAGLFSNQNLLLIAKVGR